MRSSLNRGFSTIELTIAMTVGVILVVAYFAFVNQQYRITRNTDKRLVAENAASELLEIFRAMKSDGVTKYLAQKSLPLCKPINLPNLSSGAIDHPDSMANPAEVSAFGPVPVYRGYQIEVVDMKTMLSAGCITPSGSQRYLVKAEVRWGTEAIVLSTVVPQPMAGVAAVGLDNCVFAGITLQSDGKTVVVGGCRALGANFNRAFIVARFNADGSTDATFGAAGIVLTGFPGNQPTNVAAVGASDPQAVALWSKTQSDGKIIVGGWTKQVATINEGPSRALVIRYFPNGSIDTSFGTQGAFGTVPSGNASNNYLYASRGAIQPDGKIIFGAIRSSDKSTALVRLTSNGVVDSLFGSAGFAPPVALTHLAHVKGITLKGDGSIDVGGATGSAPIPPNALLAKFRANGTLDNLFGTNGQRTVPNTLSQAITLTSAADPFSISGIPCSITDSGQILPGLTLDTGVDSTGNTVVICFANPASYQIIREYGWLTRYRPDASIDSAFAAKTKISMGNMYGWTAMNVLPDGKILVAGYGEGIVSIGTQGIHENSYSVGMKTVLKRLNADGTLDNSYGGVGTIH